MKLNKTSLLFFLLIFISKITLAQNDSLKTVPTDSVKSVQKSEPRKKEDAMILYGGVSLNDISGTSSAYNSSNAPGFMLGATYKRGRFFYWQLGIRYNNAVYEIDTIGATKDSANAVDNNFSVRDFDMPLTVGINLLSAVNRVLALRIYASAIPAYTFSVGSNDLGITTSDLNAFNIYGQAGLGIDVAFLVIDVGYNYGFKDVFKSTPSNPGQAYLTLGFRF